MNKGLFYTFLGIGLLLCLVSCRSEDYFDIQERQDQRISEFFNTKGIKNPRIKEFVEKLKLRNEENHFIERLSDKKGIPNWNALEFRKVSQTSDAKTARGGELGEYLSIPLSVNNEELSSVLDLYITEDNIHVQNVTNEKLYFNMLDSNRSIESRNGEMLNFIYFDNKVYGQQHFDNIPTGILTQMTKGTKSMDVISISLETNNLYMYVTNCYNVIYSKCSEPFWSSNYCGSDPSSPNYTAACASQVSTYCDTVSVSIDTGGSGSTSTGSGGTGSGGSNGGGSPTNPNGTPNTGGGPGGGTPPPPTPPTNPCGKAWYRHADCPDGGLGNENNPCSEIKSKFSSPKFSEKFNKLNKDSVLSLDHEMGYYETDIPNNSQNPPNYTFMTNAPNTTSLRLPDNSDYITGFMHTHDDKDGVVKIFSVADIQTFVTTILNNIKNQYGSNYALAHMSVITSEGAYMIKYNSISDFSSSIDWEKMKKEYKKEMEELVDDEKFTQPNIEKVFCKFLKEQLVIPGLELYKVDGSNTGTKKIEYNSLTKSIKESPCPN